MATFLTIKPELLGNPEYSWEEKALISFIDQYNTYWNKNGSYFCPTIKTLSKWLCIDERKIKHMLYVMSFEGLVEINLGKTYDAENNFYNIIWDNLGERCAPYREERYSDEERLEMLKTKVYSKRRAESIITNDIND